MGDRIPFRAGYRNPGGVVADADGSFILVQRRGSMRRIIAGYILSISLARAQPAPLPIRDAQTIPLWTGAAPGAQGTGDVDTPSMTAYLPQNTRAGMTAVIVLPGGGYRTLAMNHEGRQVANYLNSAGVAAFVVQYRLGPRYHHPVELEDAQRAIRMV